MMQEVTNFARFYVTFNKVRCPGDREELKCDLVRQATGGRTESLREVTRREYEDLCKSLERVYGGANGLNRINGSNEELRRHRSICLLLMQKLGIDTTNWNRINAFCLDGRIAGKVFRDLSIEDLVVLAKKLRNIERKGGIRPFEESGPTAAVVSIR